MSRDPSQLLYACCIGVKAKKSEYKAVSELVDKRALLWGLECWVWQGGMVDGLVAITGLTGEMVSLILGGRGSRLGISRVIW
jgi:hypothetical protein